MTERFDHLEGPQKLPGHVEDALKKLKRFEHLEIGIKPGSTSNSPSSDPFIGKAKPTASSGRLCPRCAQANEPERDTCWACFKPLEGKKATAAASPQDITLVLDGKTYKSTDKNLPEDVAMLMSRIQTEGYSEALLADWRSWRATRRSPPPQARPFEQETRGEDPLRDIKVFKGQRVSVIRLDGKVYTSDDKDLTPEMQALFAYVEKEGVTPALMESLRSHGDAKFRPPDTAMPSDGDVAFWKDVGAAAKAEEKPRPSSDSTTYLFLLVAAGVYVLLRVLSCG